MTHRGAALIVAIGLLAAPLLARPPEAPAGRQDRQRDEFASGLQVVDVYATVRDAGGKFAEGLTRDDFQILDNGLPAAPSVFSAESLPVNAVLMIDMSDAAVAPYARVRDGALRFVHAMSKNDRVQLGTFGQEITVNPLLSGDPPTLERIVDEELWPGGPAPVWLAARRAMDALAHVRGRRTVVVWTLGKDSSRTNPNCPQSETGAADRPLPCIGVSDVRDRVTRDGFLVYAVGFEGVKIEGELGRVADDSGGAALDVKRAADLDSALVTVLDDLHHQYVIGFTPAAADGKAHRLDVEVKRPGFTVEARRSFVAEARK